MTPTPRIRASAAGEKLSVAELRRLTECLKENCYYGEWHPSLNMKATTERLIERGFLELRGRKMSSQSQRLADAGMVRITDAGRAALQAANDGVGVT